MAHINYAARANQNALTIHDSSVDLNYNMDRSNDSVAPFGFPQRSKFIHNLTCSRSICGIFFKAAGNHICYLLWAFFRHPAVAHNSAQSQITYRLTHISATLLCIRTQRANNILPSCCCTLMRMQSLQHHNDCLAQITNANACRCYRRGRNFSLYRSELPSCWRLASAQLPEHNTIAVHVHLFSATRLAQKHLQNEPLVMVNISLQQIRFTIFAK